MSSRQDSSPVEPKVKRARLIQQVDPPGGSDPPSPDDLQTNYFRAYEWVTSKDDQDTLDSLYTENENRHLAASWKQLLPSPEQDNVKPQKLEDLLPSLVKAEDWFGMRQLVFFRLQETDPIAHLRAVKKYIGRSVAYVFVLATEDPLPEDGQHVLGYFNGLESEPVWYREKAFKAWVRAYEPATGSLYKFYQHAILELEDLKDSEFHQSVLTDTAVLQDSEAKSLTELIQLENPKESTSPRRPATPDIPVALVTDHRDKPGEIANLAAVVAGYGVNVCGAIVRRNRADADESRRALCVLLLDKDLPEGAITTLNGMGVTPRLWLWQNKEDLDLSDRPQSIGLKGQYGIIRIFSDDRPGRIARVARRLGDAGINISAFITARSLRRIRNDPKETSRSMFRRADASDEGATTLCFFDPPDVPWSLDQWNELKELLGKDLHLKEEEGERVSFFELPDVAPSDAAQETAPTTAAAGDPASA